MIGAIIKLGIKVVIMIVCIIGVGYLYNMYIQSFDWLSIHTVLIVFVGYLLSFLINFIIGLEEF